MIENTLFHVWDFIQQNNDTNFRTKVQLIFTFHNQKL